MYCSEKLPDRSANTHAGCDGGSTGADWSLLFSLAPVNDIRLDVSVARNGALARNFLAWKINVEKADDLRDGAGSNTDKTETFFTSKEVHLVER